MVSSDNSNLRASTCTQLYKYKYSYLILIIFKQIHLTYSWDLNRMNQKVMVTKVILYSSKFQNWNPNPHAV